MKKSDKEKPQLPSAIKSELLEFRLYLEMNLGKSKNTVLSYMSDSLQFAGFVFAKKMNSFADVDEFIIAEWIAKISKEVKSTTQSRKLSAMKALATFFIEERM